MASSTIGEADCGYVNEQQARSGSFDLLHLICGKRAPVDAVGGLRAVGTQQSAAAFSTQHSALS